MPGSHRPERPSDSGEDRDTARDLEVTLQSIGDAVIATNAAGQVTRMNPSAERLTGWTAVEAIGRPASEVIRLVSASTGAPGIDVVNRVLERKETIELSNDVILIRRDGREVAVADSAAPIQGDGGAIRGVVVVLSDQTARYAARRALAESEERLRLALRSANQGLYDLNVPTGHVTITPEYASMLGYDPAEFRETNAAWMARLHPDDRDRVTTAYQDYIAGRSDEYRAEFRQRTKGGGWRWILSIGSLVAWTPDGAPLRMLGTHTDITELKEAQLKLEQFKHTLDQTLDSVFMFAVDTLRFIYVNEGAKQQVGYSEAELLQMTPLDLKPDLDETSFRRMAAPLADGRLRILTFETRHRRKNGQLLPVEISLQYIADAGVAPRFVAIVRDVTERHLAEEALREREARLRTIIENEPECVKVVSATGALLEMNAAGLAMLEAGSLGEAQQRGLMGFVAPEYQDAFREMHQRVLAGGSEVLEFEVLGCQGTRRWLETHAAPLVDRTGTMLLGVTRDITERKRAEAERHQVEARLREAERMETVGQLAGGVAHDFNNLLSVINSTAELAMEGRAADDPVRQDFEEIRQAGNRAAALTGQLLAFSRTQLFSPELLDVDGLLAGIRPMLLRLIREDIHLLIRPAIGAGTILADRGQIERVLVNLVVNARDAMPRGGNLTIEASASDLTNSSPVTTPPLAAGPYVMLGLSDTGEGMDETTRTRIFEPFFTTKERGHGTGLGLSSVYGIVAQSGGGLSVSSTPGQGTTFRLYLPRVEEAAGVTPSADGASDMPRGTETILVVDDEEALLRVAKRMLDAAGYRTLVASSGPEALRLAEQLDRPLHLLFTDVVMPGMSGPELAARLKVCHPETRVLYTSGYSDNSVLRDAVQGRTAMLIGKPYAPNELHRKIREVLGR